MLLTKAAGLMMRMPCERAAGPNGEADEDVGVDDEPHALSPAFSQWCWREACLTRRGAWPVPVVFGASRIGAAEGSVCSRGDGPLLLVLGLRRGSAAGAS